MTAYSGCASQLAKAGHMLMLSLMPALLLAPVCADAQTAVRPTPKASPPSECPTDSLNVETQRFERAVYSTFKPNMIGAGRGVYSTLPTLLFDGHVAARYAFATLSRNREARGMLGVLFGRQFKVVGNLDLDIRMRDTLSKPVRMPSYKPGLFAYRQIGTRNRTLLRLGVSHYSNGQSEAQQNVDGSTNIRDGEFTSNYVDFAWVSIRDPQGAADAWTIEAQRLFSQDSYSRIGLGQSRIATSYQAQVRPSGSAGLLVRGELSAWPESRRFRGTSSATVDLLVGWSPKWMDDSGLYARFVNGVDNYNLWYDRGRQRYVQLGLMAWPFRRTL